MSEQQINEAERVLMHNFELWEQHGGPSPSTDDEVRWVAQALGVPNTLEFGVIDKIWEAEMAGIEPREVAELIVKALVSPNAAPRPARLPVCRICGDQMVRRSAVTMDWGAQGPVVHWPWLHLHGKDYEDRGIARHHAEVPL